MPASPGPARLRNRMSEEVFHYHPERLREFCARVFQSCGTPPEDASLAADVLATADLWGIDSHGIARLRAYYEMFERGLINPRPQLRTVRELPATATVDGDNGLGLVVGPKANEMALEKARTIGAAWVSVRHSNHFGVAGYYVSKGAERDLIGWAMTNTPPLVSPLWGAERMLGTNPLAVAFPAGEEPPVVIDFATSAVSFGIVETAVRKSLPLPEGLLIDKDGVRTTRPADVVEGGALLPLGGERTFGGHKGYCLAAMIDILCGALGGANWGPFIPPFPHYLKQPSRSVGKGLGHLFGAMNIEGFIDPAEFKSQVDDWVRTFRSAKPAPGTEGPLIPGDPERQAAATRTHTGIPLLKPVIDDLRHLSSRTGIPFD